ncbi:unnamed protein product, partial [Laminaria digitata]
SQASNKQTTHRACTASTAQRNQLCTKQSCTTELLALSSRQLRHIIHFLYPFHMFIILLFSRHLACDLSPLPEHGCRRMPAPMRSLV